MNAFADWLFSALFGWMGSAANGAWNALVNARGGISTFFSKYWLVLLLIVLLAGTVLDYAVWLVRWRPYLVWRSWISRRLRRRHWQRSAQDLATTDMDDQARDTLAQYVTNPDENTPINYQQAGYEEPQPYAYDQAYTPAAEPYYAQIFDQSYQSQAPVPELLFTPDQPQEPDWQMSQALWTQPGTPLEQDQASSLGYQHQPLIDYVQPIENGYYDPAMYGDGQNTAEDSAPMDVPLSDDTKSPHDGAAAGRRRRSGRKTRPTARQLYEDLKERIGNADDEQGMLDGLPSTVRPEDAFHEAIYPQDYHYQDPGNGDYGNRQ